MSVGGINRVLINPLKPMGFNFEPLCRTGGGANLQCFWIHSSTYGAPRPTASKKLIVRTVHRGRHWIFKKLQIFTRKDKENLHVTVGRGANPERTGCWEVLQHHRRVSIACGFPIFIFRTCDKMVSDNSPRHFSSWRFKSSAMKEKAWVN